METNRNVLLIDGNWLLISRFSVLSQGFIKDNPVSVKEHAQTELSDMLARSINVIINRFKSIDNIILVADGGSWRKDVERPVSLGDITYKGNREEEREKTEIDFEYVFPALNNLIDQAKKLGITVAREGDCEGDDQICYWSRKLNSIGINCIIWSSDCDLKQLCRFDPYNYAFTVWYNDKNGVWISEDMRDDSEDIDFFMKPQPDSMVLEDLKRRSKMSTYFNPNHIVIEKVICGDAGDNIMPLIRYKKGERTYGIGKKDYEKLCNELNINTIGDLFDNDEKICRWLLQQPKYKGLGIKDTELLNRFWYNVRVVYLHEDMWPEDIKTKLDSTEYKKFDLSYIKSNYRCLVPEDESEIEALFEGSKPDWDTPDLPF